MYDVYTIVYTVYCMICIVTIAFNYIYIYVYIYIVVSSSKLRKVLDQFRELFTKRVKLFCYGDSCFGTVYLFRPIHKICYNNSN